MVPIVFNRREKSSIHTGNRKYFILHKLMFFKTILPHIRNLLELSTVRVITILSTDRNINTQFFSPALTGYYSSLHPFSQTYFEGLLQVMNKYNSFLYIRIMIFKYFLYNLDFKFEELRYKHLHKLKKNVDLCFGLITTMFSNV